MRIELESLERAISAVGDPGASVRVGLERVRRQCERLGRIVQRTRDRVVKPAEHSEQVDLGRVASEIPTLLERELQAASARLELSIPPNLPSVRADAVELQQVFVNLVMNAIDAVRAVPGHARVICIQIDVIENGLIAKVADTGPGIDSSLLTNILQPFFTTKSGHVGMGLQICRAIVESLGGDFQASNRAEGGALFQFCLPCGSCV